VIDAHAVAPPRVRQAVTSVKRCYCGFASKPA
jgi:hypothetical protein